MLAARQGSVENIKALLGHAYAEHYQTRTPAPIDSSRIVDVDLIKRVCGEAGKVTPRSSGEEDGFALQQLKKQGIGGVECAVVKGNLQTYTALTLAVECGHHQAVQTLLNLGANPDKTLGAAKRKMAPIHIAAERGHVEIMKTLMLHAAKTRVKDRHGLTAFHYAAKYNQLPCLSWLAGNVVSDADAGDSSGNTALQYACAEGAILVVKYLVEDLQVDITQANSWGMTALEVAVLRQQNGVVDYLLTKPNVDINFRDNSGATMIMKLAYKDILKEKDLVPLLHMLDKPGIDVKAVDNNGCNVLHYTALQLNGTPELYDKILQIFSEHGVDINSKTNNGKTALLIAAANKRSRGWNRKEDFNMNLFRALVKHGAGIKEVEMEGNTNIVQHFARIIKESTLDLFEVIESSCKNSGVMKDMINSLQDDGFSALLIAANSTFNCKDRKKKEIGWRIIERLLGNAFQGDINSEVGKRKIDPEKKCICKADNKPCTNRSCPIFPYTESGKMRILNFSMKFGTPEDTKKVLSYSPELNYMDGSGMYPIQHAVQGNKPDLVSLLIQRGALLDLLPGPGLDGKNPHEDTPIMVLAARFSLPSVLPLSDAGACTLAQAPDGRNVLHHVVSHHTDLPTRIDIAEKFLPGVEKVNEADAKGNTYLHHAVSGVDVGSNVSIEMVSSLLLAGADPNRTNNIGQTPLHFAFVGRDHSFSMEFSDPIEVVSMLTTVMDEKRISEPDYYNGFSALHLCAMQGGSVTATHLISHGCDMELLDKQGNTPLNLAIAGKHQSCVLMLLEKGAAIDRCICHPLFKQDPATLPKQDQTRKEQQEEEEYVWLPLQEKPLHAPISTVQSTQILYRVIQHGWQGVLFKLVDLLKQSFVPLEAAISQGKYNLAITLLLKFGKTVVPGDCNSKGQTLVHTLAQTPGSDVELQVRLLNLLIKFGYSVTTRDTAYKCTPLHYACLMKKQKLCELLVKVNTVNVKDYFGRSPICALFWNESPDAPDLARFLVKEGAQLETTCDFNIQESQYPLFDHTFSVSRDDYFTSFSDRYTLLIKTIILNNQTQFDLLLELGAKVYTPCSKGMTPLMYAARLNRVRMFERLVGASNTGMLLTKSDEGRTIMHYLVLAQPRAQLADPVILKSCVQILQKHKSLKRALEIRDNQGKTVPDYCVGLSEYLTVLGITYDTTEVSNSHEPMEVAIPDFDTDCTQYLQNYHSANDTSTLGAPDPCLSLSESECEVYQDETGHHWDMLLTKIDIKARSHGLYNFYKLQLIRNKGKDIYLLLTKWGRIGDTGQHQETPFPTLAGCKSEFVKVFKSKTKNDWGDLESFVNHPGKYRLVPVELRYPNLFSSIKFDFVPGERPEELNRGVFEVLVEGSNTEAMRKYMTDTFQLDIARLPFGFVSAKTIQEATELLDKIADLVKLYNKLLNDSGFSFSQDKLQQYAATCQELYDLTNEIYHLIPRKGFNVTKIAPILDDIELESWRFKLQNMRDSEVINRILAASQCSPSTVHPIQYIYNCLGCGVTPLDPGNMVSQYLIRSGYAAGVASGIRGIYRVTPDYPDLREKGQKYLMFHGISTGALLSILKRGLQNAPFGREYGTLFGEGIYLADNLAKSLSYAQGHTSRFVLVVSVRLGKVFSHVKKSGWYNKAPEPPADTDTLWVMGKLRQDPVHDVVLPCGGHIGLGMFGPAKREVFPVEDGVVDVIRDFRGRREGEWSKCKYTVSNDDKEREGEGDLEIEDSDSNSDEKSDGGSSDDDSETEKKNDDKSDEPIKKLLSDGNYRCLPEHNEFVIKSAKEIRLEYLIQIR